MTEPDVSSTPPPEIGLPEIARFLGVGTTALIGALLAPMESLSFFAALTRYEPYAPNMLEVVGLGSTALSLYGALAAGSLTAFGFSAAARVGASVASGAGVVAFMSIVLYSALLEIRLHMLIALLAALWPVGAGIFSASLFGRPLPGDATSRRSFAIALGIAVGVTLTFSGSCAGLSLASQLGALDPMPLENVEPGNGGVSPDENRAAARITPPAWPPTANAPQGAASSTPGWNRIEFGDLSIEIPEKWSLYPTGEYTALFAGDGEYGIEVDLLPIDSAETTADVADHYQAALTTAMPGLELRRDYTGEVAGDAITRRQLFDAERGYFQLVMRDIDGVRFASTAFAPPDATPSGLDRLTYVEATLRYLGTDPSP